MNRPNLQLIDDLDGLPNVGDVLHGKYLVEGLLGVGGMAAVLAAKHLTLRERVAIKMLLPEWSGNPELAERFLNEGRAATKIRSEHVVRVLDVDEVDGRPYLVLEYLDGVDLDRLVATEGPRPISEAVDFVLQACEAMAEAHLAGIVHRDLKPANLFLCHRADGSPCVKVLDFGISKITGGTVRESGLRSVGTAPTAVMGSPHYMSPEQMASSSNVDARADIWSLGAIFHELLAGEPPFQAETITGLCSRILKDPPPPLSRIRADVPAELEDVVFRCLEKEPSDRFPDVAEVARAFAPFGSAEAVASAERIARIFDGKDPTPSRPPGEVASHRSGFSAELRASEILAGPRAPVTRRPVAGYVVLGLVLSLFAVAAGWKWRHDVRATRDARREIAVTATLQPAPPALDKAASPPPAIVAPVASPLPEVPVSTTAAPAATIASAAPAPAALHAHHHHVAAQRTAGAVLESPPPDDNPYGSPTAVAPHSPGEDAPGRP